VEIKRVKITEIKKNPDNPRTIKKDKFEKLVRSVRDFPAMLELRPIVVDAAGMILGGNMRYEACVAAGMKEIPVVYADTLTDEQKREFIIKDNVPGGEWDFDKLANEWDDELLKKWGLDFPGADENDGLGGGDGDGGDSNETHTCPKCGHIFSD